MGAKAPKWQSPPKTGSPQIVFGEAKARNSTFEQILSRLRGLHLRKKGAWHMQRKDYKGRCEKRKLGKAKEVCRFYSDIQSAYGDTLEGDTSVVEIVCNAPMEGLALGDYTSDFLCKLADSTYMVRECVQRKFLTKPKTYRELEVSRDYWRKHGIDNWGLVIDMEGQDG